LFTAYYHDCQYFLCQDKGIKIKADKRIEVAQPNNQRSKTKMHVLDITYAGLKFKMDQLKDTISELNDVKNNPTVREKIMNHFQECESYF